MLSSEIARPPDDRYLAANDTATAAVTTTVATTTAVAAAVAAACSLYYGEGLPIQVHYGEWPSSVPPSSLHGANSCIIRRPCGFALSFLRH